MLALSYRLAGWAGGSPLPAALPAVGAWLNAVLGAAGALAAYRLARAATRPRWALAAGLAVALHPGMVLYTPALMTEGVTAALLTLAAWMASLRSRRGVIFSGLIMGVATLVRPQSLLLAPCWGLMSARPHQGLAARARRALLATALALAVCAPWTLRNCVRMKQCALVSFNGGWNLLIGASEQATGSWAPIDVPLPCRTVWDEAGKDACFGQEARQAILRDPVRWLGLVPRRLAATFDYAGAAGFYLHQSNPEAFDDQRKTRLGVVETVYERLAYLGALGAAAYASGPRRRARGGLAALFGLLLFRTHAYVAVLGLGLVIALRGRALSGRGPALALATLFVLAATALRARHLFRSGEVFDGPVPLGDEPRFCLAFARSAP